VLLDQAGKASATWMHVASALPVGFERYATAASAAEADQLTASSRSLLKNGKAPIFISSTVSVVQ
jgi:hypothetical protein